MWKSAGRAMFCLCEFYSGICLTTEEKAQKNLSQGNENKKKKKKNSQGKINIKTTCIDRIQMQ